MLVYLSGPISEAHGYTVEQHVEAAVAVYFSLVAQGIDVLCPHLSALFPGGHAISYERWMALDFAMIDVCSHVLMLPRWETSAGAVREKTYAEQQGKIVCLHISSLTQLHT